MRTLAGGLAMCALSASAGLPLPVGLDAPSAKKSRVVGPSPLTKADVVETCWVSALGYAVVEVNDPGLMGATKIEARWRAADAGKANLCGAGAGLQTRELKQSGYLMGTAGPFIFVSAPDAFGSEIEFEVFDARTGASVLKAVRNLLEPLQVRQRGARVSLDFYRALVTDCSVAKGGDACWAQLRKKNGIPPEVKVAPPGCREQDATQVSVPVVVDELGKTQLRFVDGAATCNVPP